MRIACLFFFVELTGFLCYIISVKIIYLKGKCDMLIENPIKLPGNEPIRDPMILPFNGRYYMVGTCAPFWEGANPGVKLWVSDDLINWKFVKLLIDASKIDDGKPYKDRFWAPEIFHHKNKFYLHYIHPF